jgi:hypothetical protein
MLVLPGRKFSLKKSKIEIGFIIFLVLLTEPEVYQRSVKKEEAR